MTKPLDTEGALWVAALDRVPIEERIEWVKTILGRVEQINAKRAAPGADAETEETTDDHQ